MDRLRGPPVLNAGNKQQTDPVRFSDRISHKKGMTMNLKNKKGKRLTSTLMAVLMSVSTTLTPVNSIASEMETSSMAVESITEETTAETEVQTTVETTASSEAQTSTSASETQAITEETTAETDQLETESSVAEEVQSSGESAEETSANETRGPDETQENETTAESESETEEVTETETVEETSSEEPTIDLSAATREDILSYIEAIGGDESDDFYSFIGSLGEYDYQLVWMAQYGAQEDQLLENFGFDYDGSSDLDVAKYIHKLSEDELADFTESMTFEQYRRYLSIREMMAEMDEKDFADVIDEEEFTSDRTWDYESYDAFAESLTGVSLQRTEQTMQFYNTYVDPSKVQAGVTTIDGLLDSNADWYSNDYILGLNPEMFKETVPVYHGADGNYYVVSMVPTLNGVESADYQPATSFYNGSVEAQAFTDIEYLGNGVYRIPSSRYQYCFTEQYVSDMGTLYGISFGLRIQVLYGFTPSGEINITADVVYPDMTERFLPAKLNLLAGIATVRVFNDDYEESVDNYLVSASINRGAGLPDSVGSMNDGKVLQFVVGDANAVGSLDVLIGYNAASKYSMAAEVTTAELIGSASGDENINLAAEMYNGAYLKLDQGSVPKNLAVGDKFIYANTALTITGVTTAYDGRGGTHIGATEVPTHDAQSFCLYNGKGVEPQISSWFKTKLNTNSADPGYMVQMTAANISKRASYNGSSVNLSGNKIFGYRTDGLGAVSGTDGKVLNLEGTNVLLSCMHAWGNESASTPQDIVDAISTFTGRTQKDYAIDEGFGHYHPNVALQCTDVHDGGDGNMYATFKVVTSMLQVGGVVHPQNYQCAFATISIVYPSAPKNGYLKIHKSSANPEMTDKNSCYKFEGIRYGIFTDAACVNNLVVLTLDANGYSQPYELPEGTYYVREADAAPGSGYQTNGTVYTVTVTAGTTADEPVTCETVDQPLNDPMGIVINKINGDGATAADLSGAEYTITYYPKQYTSVAEIEADTDPDVKPTVWVIQTLKAENGNYQAVLDDAHIVPNSNSAGAVFGKTHVGNYIIPLGTITVEETKAPAGFTKDGAIVSSVKTGATISGTNNVYLFQFVDENSAVYLKSGNTLSTSLDDEKAVTLTYAEAQNRAGIKVVKYDIAKKGAFDTWDGPQGLASLKGIRFAIINKNGDAVKNSAGTLVPDGGVMQVLTTDKNGYAATGVSDLPTGKYLVKELRKDATVSGTTLNEGTSTLANDTYMWADNSAEVVLTDSDKNSLKWALAFYNSPVSAVPKFEKHDLELGKKAPMAGTSMAGIIYGIYNDSDHPIKINGKTYKKDEVIQRIYADKDGNFTFTTSLPYGHYYVKEGENLHYIGSTTKHYFHVISKDGKGAIFYEKKPGGSETDRYDSVFFSNRVIRGDVSLTKKNGETNETLAYIPFRITNNATGETHYILTGADGSYTSAAGKTTNTNANDTALSKYGESDVIPQSVIDSLTKDAGLWFGLGSEGTMTKANNSYGALVYGTYTITELKTEATTSMDMYSYTFEVKKDGKLIDLGTINNYSVGIQTTLADANGSHTVEAGKSVTLTDHVAYKNLDTTKKYTLTGTLYAKDNDNLTKLMEKTVEFTPAKENGTQDVTFTFDASTLVGKSVVCFEELFLNGELRASHKDKNDHNQTVTFPSVEGIPVMEKHDLELNKKAAMGGTSFEGITFEIYNDSEAAVLIDGNSYQKGEIIATAVSDAAGTITTNVKFPAGRYSIKEKSVNNQYTLTDEESHTFTVSYQNGKTVVSYESGANAVIFKDRVVRGDMSFVKKNSDTGEALAYVPFRVTNNTTGETHYILTGADGTYTSAARKTINTNANDAVLSKYGDKDVIPQSVVDSLAKDAGLWFGMGSEGTMTAANDSYGSFIYGTYTITELKTEATRSMKMYTSTFTIDTDGKVLDLGTVNNVLMGIKTTLVDVNKEHFTEPVSSITLTDHVAYKNLDTDKTYTLTGTLYVKEGDALTELMTETVDFTPAEKNGIQDVTFTFDASALKGKSVVAFEELSVNGEFCAEHKDKDDENQTVTFPDIQTTARDNVTEDHVSNAADSVTIIDTVTYTGLKAGETYEITGTLMDAETGEAALDDDGNAITASKEFTAPTADGNIDITFTFAGVSLAGKTLVAFEDISYEGRRYAVHADINDKNQTVYIPKIRTKALDASTGLNQVLADSNTTVVDTVTYTHLLPGKTYVMKGVLMTSAGNALMVNGKTITASTEFVPTTPDGTVDVIFNFDASEIGGRKLVFYEYLELDGNTVASHTDISDTDQTVYVPKLRTTIFDSENGSHNSAADEDITLIDTVRYNGVEIGRKYTVVGTLVDKETGNALFDDAGNKITASNEFVAEKTNGTIDVTFKFSGKCRAGKTTVAFEDMYSEGKKVAVHADLRDEGQTEYFPSVHTTATSNDTEDHVVGANEKVTITDQVALKALKLGTEYTLSGTLMNAKTGKPIMVNGNTITARRTFTADAHEMTIPLTYTLNASELAGTTTVVFENLYSDGALLAAHADLEDAEQTVYIPEIHTTAKDQTTKINHTEANKTATIIDTVSYTNLLPGREYTVSGTLMDKETGKAVLADGKEITASTTFTPEKSEGSVDVVFTFDASVVAPKTVVAFETLTYKKIQIAVHAEIEDKDQTVYIPKVRTTAIADDTKDHVTEAKKDVTIVDTVSYEGLEVDREYTVKGVLMNKATGKAIMVNGKEVTAESTFTAKAQKGTVDVTFKFDGSALEDTLIVVFETLYTEGKEVGVHTEINDDAQTVYIPKIRTNAEDTVTKINHTEAKPQATIIDTVKYSSLLPGKEYTMTGTLMNKETGKPILIDGKKVTSSTTFTAEKSSKSVEVVFSFDASVLEGTTVVAYENLTYKGVEVAIHADITDEDQTIYIPKVRTTAIADDTKDHVTKAKKDVTIVDTVSYEGLEVDREYTVKGVLMNKATGEAITVNGKEVTAESAFTAKAQKGTVDVTFKFDGSAFEDTLLVAFETLYTESKEVGVHADINDDAQTVYIPKIRTNAEDAVTKINHTEAKPQATIIDTVSYSSLLPGKEYTMTGTLMNKNTKEPILIDGEPINASTIFTAEKSRGSVKIVFKFDASVLQGTTVVVYESMTYKGVEVAIHADITDEDQTIYIPKVRTTAIADDTKDHVTKAKKDVTIVDTVSYEGLEVGCEYTVKGVLMNKATGEAIIVNGKEVTAESTFTAKAQKGTVDVTFKFDGSAFEDTLLVAFETLYTEGKEVGVHAEINDDAQTVYIPKIRTNAKDAVTKINHTEAKPQATIIDTVKYSSLLPGKEYTMTGTLMNKETGKPILIDGKKVTSSTTFTAEKSSKSVEVVFSFDASVLEGTTVVAYENLTYKGVEVAIHADITDEDQTIYIPKVRTTAIADDTKDHVTKAKKDVTIVDTVSYEGLEVDREYTVKGVLMNKATGEAITVNGEKVTSSATFTPKEKNGTVDVTFTFDGSALADILIVVFETLYTEEKEVGVHAEIEDDAQTVYLPKIQTEAKDAVTEIDHTEVLPKARIIDTVSYSSLLPGKEYTVTGTLMNKETKEPVLIDGEKVTASTTFTAEKAEGSVEIVFEFDASAIAGTTVVAFESMEYKGVEVAVHADIEDEDQTVYIPDVHTTATAANTTKDHVTGANEDLIITDEVVLTGLKVGNEYTVKGVLMDKSTGEELKVNDESITADETFTADAAEMTITLTYTLDAKTLAGTTTVVFETLYTEGKEVGRHHEIDDEGQTVYIPEIHTTAKDQTTKINHTEANDKATIVDTVYYSHLLPGKEYTVHGILMDKKTGEPILIDSKEITASTTFTAENEEGSVDVIFTFDASILAPKTVVAFEYMEYEGIEIAVHEDIDDEDQTVYILKIHTTAVGEDTQDHIEKAKEEAVIVDTVSYEGLQIGREYTVTGKLMDKETGEPILVNGEEVTASETFTAETEEGGIDITFTFDSSALAGKSLVAFETLYTEEKEVAVHADITDEGQTVRIPEIHTTATDKVTGDHDGVVAKETTVLDEVFYTNLIPGKEYTVSGKLMVKETGEPLTIDGKEVTAEKTFVAEEADGSIILEFTFDSSALAGKKIVAFEDVTYEGISIGTHEDLTDEDQTISYPEIHTTAADQASGSKTMTLGSSVTLVDTVTYKGLTAGKTYVLKGTIMDKASGEPIGVTAETTFTAEAADGSVEVTFTFDTTQLQGKTLVVFETLYDTQGNPIVAHSDLNDEDQTVSVPVQPVIPPVVTGDDSSPMPYVLSLLAAIAAAAAVAAVLVRRKRHQA